MTIYKFIFVPLAIFSLSTLAAPPSEKLTLSATCSDSRGLNVAEISIDGTRATVVQGNRRADLFQIRQEIRSGGMELGYTERLNGGARIQISFGSQMKPFISSAYVNTPGFNGITFVRCESK